MSHRCLRASRISAPRPTLCTTPLLFWRLAPAKPAMMTVPGERHDLGPPPPHGSALWLYGDPPNPRWECTRVGLKCTRDFQRGLLKEEAESSREPTSPHGLGRPARGGPGMLGFGEEAAGRLVVDTARMAPVDGVQACSLQHASPTDVRFQC